LESTEEMTDLIVIFSIRIAQNITEHFFNWINHYTVPWLFVRDGGAISVAGGAIDVIQQPIIILKKSGLLSARSLRHRTQRHEAAVGIGNYITWELPPTPFWLVSILWGGTPLPRRAGIVGCWGIPPPRWTEITVYSPYPSFSSTKSQFAILNFSIKILNRWTCWETWSLWYFFHSCHWWSVSWGNVGTASRRTGWQITSDC
jgi:hypothetical protein